MHLQYEDLAIVMRGLPELRGLQVCGCNQLSSEDISALQEEFPGIHLDLSSHWIRFEDSDLRMGTSYQWCI